MSTIVIMLDQPSPADAPATGASTAEAAVEASAGDSTEFVQSLERGLSVIRAFDAEHSRLTLSEVAAATGLSRAAARRFLHTLVHLGYMRTAGGRFELRPKILELGYAYLSSLTLPEVAMPHLEELVEEVHESSSVSELDGERRRLHRPRPHQADHDGDDLRRHPFPRLRDVDGPGAARRPARAVAGRVPVHRVAAPPHRAHHHHGERAPPGAAQDQGQGWALIDQELEEGLRSLAAPIRDSDGTVIAAVNVSTHAGRRSLDAIVADLLSPLLATAERIERDLASARTTAGATGIQGRAT